MKNVIVLEDHRITYVQEQPVRGGVRIKSCRDYDLQANDAPGADIMDEKDQVKQVLEEITVAEKLRGKPVTIVMESKAAMHREVLLPPIKNKKELNSVLFNELSYYNTDVSHYTIEYLPTDRKAEDGKAGYITYAIPNDIIEGIFELAKATGIKLQAIEYVPDTLGKLTAMCYPTIRNAVLVIVESHNIELYFIENGRCILTRLVRLEYKNFEKSVDILTEEVADQINKLLQFNSTRKVDSPVQNVFIISDEVDVEQFAAQLQVSIDEIRPDELVCLPFVHDANVHLDFDDGTANIVGALKAAGALVKH